jgi:protein TonB
LRNGVARPDAVDASNKEARMSITWNETAATANAGVRLRLMFVSAAALMCAGLLYLAVTQRFGVLTELFAEDDAIETVIELPNDPPPPPPVIHNLEPPPPAQQQSIVNENAPPTPTFEFVTESPPAPPSSYITDATFLDRPSGRDFERYFPPRALERGVSARVVLDCTVAADGRVGCNVASEEPAGWGFGEASLRAARHFRVAPATSNGQATSGGRLRVPMTWRAQ